MIARPSAHSSGKYDGDGMWMTVRRVLARRRRRPTSCAVLGGVRRTARQRRDLDRVEVHALGVLHRPPGVARVDRRDAREVVDRRRRRDRPLERGAVPRVVRRDLAASAG